MLSSGFGGIPFSIASAGRDRKRLIELIWCPVHFQNPSIVEISRWAERNCLAGFRATPNAFVDRRDPAWCPLSSGNITLFRSFRGISSPLPCVPSIVELQHRAVFGVIPMKSKLSRISALPGWLNNFATVCLAHLYLVLLRAEHYIGLSKKRPPYLLLSSMFQDTYIVCLTGQLINFPAYLASHSKLQAFYESLILKVA